MRLGASSEIGGMTTKHRSNVSLRPVSVEDLEHFYEHQLDEAATRMAAFASRDRASFREHWHRILNDDGGLERTVVVDGEIAGNIVSFLRDGRREIGYWFGRRYWGRGIATRALTTFLEIEGRRPLFAAASERNPGSQRVLEKCGFVRVGQENWLDDETGDVILGLVYELGPK